MGIEKLDGGYERLDRKLVRKAHIFNMYEDTLKMPDGHVAIYDYLEHKGAAAVIPVLPDGKILMVKQFRNALNRYTLEIPAGGRDSLEEDYKIAAARELEEETGYKSNHLTHLIDVRTAVAFCNEIICIYVADQLEKSVQNLDEDEFIDVRAYTTEELNDMIAHGIIEDSKTVSAIMAYQVLYRR